MQWTLLPALLLGASCPSGRHFSPYPTRAHIPWAAGGYELPTQRCGDYFVVDARINGEGPFPLLLDTGARTTHLDPSVVERVAPGRFLDSLQLGGFKAWNVGFDVLDMDALARALGRPVLGIVGHPVFAAGPITYDFPAGRVLLHRAPLEPRSSGTVRVVHEPGPMLPLRRGSGMDRVLLDTGSAWGLSLTGLERWPLAAPPRVTSTRVRVDGLHLVYSSRIRGRVLAGPLVLDDPVVHNAADANLLGLEVLHHFRVTIDQTRNLVRFERPDAPVGTPLRSPPLTSWGLALAPAAATQDIVAVLPGSPAHRAGITPADTIVAVEGRPPGAGGCAPPRSLLPATQATLQLTLRRRGALRQVRLSPDVVVP